MRFVATVVGVAAAVVAMPSMAAPSARSTPPSVCKLGKTARTGALFSVPFRVVDGRIYVSATINGRGPFDVAVDTGAGGMGRADTSLVNALQLPVSGVGKTSDGIATSDVDTVRLSSIDVGGFVRRDLEVATRDYGSRLAPEARFAAILGRGFFGDGLLVIDYPARRLTFTRAVAVKGDGQGILSYEKPFRVPVTIGKTATQGNLDTGANVAFVFPKKLFDDIGGGPVQAAGQGKLTNTEVSTGKAIVEGPFRIGAFERSNVEVRVSDRYPELLVGAHFLQQVTILIDQRYQRIALCP